MPVTFNPVDSFLEQNIISTATNKRLLISNSASPPNKQGLICNLDINSKIISSTNTFKVYLWVMSASQTNNRQFKIYGCAASPAPCLVESDYTVQMSGSIFNQNDLKIETFSIVAATANTVLITHTNTNVI